MQSRTITVVLCLASYTEHNVFEVNLCCSMYQCFVSFYCQIVAHCVDIPPLFIYFNIRGFF